MNITCRKEMQSSRIYGATAPREAKTESEDAMMVAVASTSSLVHAASMASMQPPLVRHIDPHTLQMPTNLGAAEVKEN
jgi:hypothetical protein